MVCSFCSSFLRFPSKTPWFAAFVLPELVESHGPGQRTTSASTFELPDDGAQAP